VRCQLGARLGQSRRVSVGGFPLRPNRQRSMSDWWRQLTIVVQTSPVTSNPSTKVLSAMFASFGLVPSLPLAPKIIQLDGPQDELPKDRVVAYNKFERRVRELAAQHADFANTRVYRSTAFLFAAHNLGAAINHVVTPFMLVLQHDFLLVRPFDPAGLLRTMARNPSIKHVRLNARANVARGFDGYIANYTGDTDVPLARTCGWSDSAHVASTSYYRSFCIPINAQDQGQGHRKFMEESLHYRMQRNGAPGGCWELKRNATRPGAELRWPIDFDDYGTYLYGHASPADGNYMSHKSLRGDQPQWGLGGGRTQDEPIGRGKGRGKGRGAGGEAEGSGSERGGWARGRWGSGRRGGARGGARVRKRRGAAGEAGTRTAARQDSVPPVTDIEAPADLHRRRDSLEGHTRRQ
jgi:hypothetical protein